MVGSKKKMKMKTKKRMEKVEKEKGSSSIPYEELRDDLFREAAKLVAEDPHSKIAILITPPSGSNESVHAFGHPSAEGVVKTFLKDNRQVPVLEDAEKEEEEENEEEEEAQPFWWEDNKLIESMNRDQLEEACKDISDLLRHFKAMRDAHDSGKKNDPKP